MIEVEAAIRPNASGNSSRVMIRFETSLMPNSTTEEPRVQALAVNIRFRSVILGTLSGRNHSRGAAEELRSLSRLRGRAGVGVSP